MNKFLKSALFLIFVIILFSCKTTDAGTDKKETKSAQTTVKWNIYDCGVLPDAANPSFSVSNVKGAETKSEIVNDTEIQGNKLLKFDASSKDVCKFAWLMNWDLKGATIVF